MACRRGGGNQLVFDAAAIDGQGKEEGGALKVLRKRGNVGQGRLGQGGPAGNGGIRDARLGQEAGRQDNGAVGPVTVVGKGGLATLGAIRAQGRMGRMYLCGTQEDNDNVDTAAAVGVLSVACSAAKEKLGWVPVLTFPCSGTQQKKRSL